MNTLIWIVPRLFLYKDDLGIKLSTKVDMLFKKKQGTSLPWSYNILLTKRQIYV